MDASDYAIEELAECVKELVRLAKLSRGPRVEDAADKILDDIYQKATKAKNRVQS